MYIIYDPSTGMIQSTISGPGKEYGPEQLTKRNQTWIWLEGAMNVDPMTNYIDVQTQVLTPFRPMRLSVDKTQFIADGKDEFKITGIPLGSSVAISCNGIPQSSHISQSGEIELTANASATYEINMSCWKYLPAQIIVQALQPVQLSNAGNVPTYNFGNTNG